MNYNGQLIALNQEEGTYNFNGNHNTLKIDISSVKINLNGNKNSIDVKDSRAAIEIKGDQNRLNIYGSDVTLTDIGQDNIVESCPNSRVRIVKINNPQNILNVPEKQGGFYCQPRIFQLNPVYYSYTATPKMCNSIEQQGPPGPAIYKLVQNSNSLKSNNKKDFLTKEDYASLADIIVAKFPQISNETQTYAGENGEGLYGTSPDLIPQPFSPNQFSSSTTVSAPISKRLACQICKQVMANGQTHTTTHCGHTFHSWCLGNWVQHAKTCPICEFYIVSEP